MIERVYEVSSDKDVHPPACLVVVDANNQPFANSMIILSKTKVGLLFSHAQKLWFFILWVSKNIVPIKYPSLVDRLAIVELDSSEKWWFQEVIVCDCFQIHSKL